MQKVGIYILIFTFCIITIQLFPQLKKGPEMKMERISFNAKRGIYGRNKGVSDGVCCVTSTDGYRVFAAIQNKSTAK